MCGDRTAQLDAAVQLLCGHPQIRHVMTSAYLGTATGRRPGRTGYVSERRVADHHYALARGVACCGCAMSKLVWAGIGVSGGDREIDIDILLYAEIVSRTENW